MVEKEPPDNPLKLIENYTFLMSLHNQGIEVGSSLDEAWEEITRRFTSSQVAIIRERLSNLPKGSDTDANFSKQSPSH